MAAPMSPVRERLTGRFAVLGVALLVVLGALLVQAWNLQVLNGAQYAGAAASNRTRTVSLPAARGNILDDKGRPLVTNRAVMEVTALPAVAQDTTLEARISSVIGVSVPEIQKKMTSYKAERLAPRVLKVDVPMTTAAYIYEHQAEFPGVAVEPAAVRVYPNKSLAAQVLGYTGEISDVQMKSGSFPGAELGDIVGKSGVEEYYDHALEGVKGFNTYEVNAAGQPTMTISHGEPRAGSDVELTIDTNVQKVTEKSLADAIASAHAAGFTKASAGAAVVLDVKTGGIVAMASAPTYDPSQFLNGISDAEWASLTATSAEYPLNNRAIMSAYAPGSTFKAVVAMGALQTGVIRTSTMFDCVGIWRDLGTVKKNWTTVDQGWHSVVWAIEQSSDTFFYNVGKAFWLAKGEKLQAFARSVGFGAKLGVDLPGEVPGRVPDAAWKKAYNAGYPDYQAWVGGDTVNMAIGQGDLLVTPLQLADYYATLANGGHPLKPHVLKAVLDSQGKPAIVATATPLSDPGLSAANLATLRRALVGVTTVGTGASAFSGFPVEVAGKTGTAQYGIKKDDYAWFACYAPANKPRYAVVVVVEQGGHGGSIAAPAARQIMSALFNVPWHPIIAHDVSR